MKIGFAQINPTVGDLKGNAALVLAQYRALVEQGASLVLTPELALTGYPPQDLLFQSGFVDGNLSELAGLAQCIGEAPLIVGYVDFFEGSGRPFRNAAAVLREGKVVAKVFKSLLPTYDVFDEARYFEPAAQVAPIELLGRCIGITHLGRGVPATGVFRGIAAWFARGSRRGTDSQPERIALRHWKTTAASGNALNSCLSAPRAHCVLQLRGCKRPTRVRWQFLALWGRRLAPPVFGGVQIRFAGGRP